MTVKIVFALKFANEKIEQIDKNLCGRSVANQAIPIGIISHVGNALERKFTRKALSAVRKSDNHILTVASLLSFHFFNIDGIAESDALDYGNNNSVEIIRRIRVVI